MRSWLIDSGVYTYWFYHISTLDPEDVFEFYSRLLEYCASEAALDKEMSAVCKVSELPVP